MIDLDRVIFNCKSIPYTIGNRFFTLRSLKTKLKYYQVSPEIAINYKNKLSFLRFCNKNHLKPVTDSIKYLKNWHTLGIEIHFVSCRPKLKSFQKAIVDWLTEQNIHFDSLVFSCSNKAKYCYENKMDVIIDDTITNCINSLLLGIHSIWFTDAKNLDKTPSSEPFYVAKCWSSINDIVINLNQKLNAYTPENAK